MAAKTDNSITAIGRALAAHGDLKAGQAESKSKAAEFRLKYRVKAETIERQRQEMLHQKAAHLNNPKKVPAPSREAEDAAARDEAELPALLLASQLADKEADERQRAVNSAHGELVGATLDYVHERQRDGVAAVKTALTKLAPAFVNMLAADIVRAAIIGESYPLQRGQVPPFKTQKLLESFIANLPARIRPEELKMEALIKEARGISATVISEIKGEIA